VLEAVRAAVSDRLIVAFRMAVDQCITGGLGPADMIEIARRLTATGAVDLISVSGGTGSTRLGTAHFVPPDELPEGVYNERAAHFRQAVGVPVLVAGRNVEPEVAEACVLARDLDSETGRDARLRSGTNPAAPRVTRT
jgi:2,4-dienoyl-CoA reductase-like NADH-dependent reductase (Old Yellow Enzyme family)